MRSKALKRSLRVFGTLLLTLSAVTPASSVFVIVPGVITEAGTGAFWAMILGALLSVPTAYVYAELSSAFPIAGGEYCMVGRTVGRDAGIAVMWLNAFSSLLTPAAFGLGSAAFIGVVIPGLNTTAVAIGIILVTTVLGVLHIRTNAWVTGLFLLVELLALVAVTWLGFSHMQRPLSEIALHPVFLDHGALHATPLAIIGLATSVAIFAYNGYGSAVYFAEEMHEVRSAVAKTILWALVITVITELVPVTAVLLGASDLKALFASQNPFSDFVLAAGGGFFNAAVSIGIALAIINAVLATVLQNARFFYRTGHDGTWHGRLNHAFTVTHPRFQSPWLATLIAGFVSIALCFLGLDLILMLTGTGIVLVYIGVCLAAIFGRRSGASDAALYRMPLYPVWPVVGLIALAYVLYTSALDPELGRPSLLINGGIVVLSIVYYRLVLRRGRDWVLSEPDESPV
jgi:amino acid transporter